jgi:hypothetical protein
VRGDFTFDSKIVPQQHTNKTVPNYQQGLECPGVVGAGSGGMKQLAQAVLVLILVFGAFALPEICRWAGRSGPEIHFRFSLRMLLAAMTFAAILLWLIGYSTGK